MGTSFHFQADGLVVATNWFVRHVGQATSELTRMASLQFPILTNCAQPLAARAFHRRRAKSW